jgi:CheY-like chemotaxis protein
MHILVVDDDDSQRAATRQRLTSHGHTVSEASGAGEALAHLRAALRPLVVLVDYLLPEMHGYRFLHALEKEQALARRHLIVVTAAHPALVEQPVPAVAGRWTRVLPKPVTSAALQAAVAMSRRSTPRLAACRAPTQPPLSERRPYVLRVRRQRGVIPV